MVTSLSLFYLLLGSIWWNWTFETLSPGPGCCSQQARPQASRGAWSRSLPWDTLAPIPPGFIIVTLFIFSTKKSPIQKKEKDKKERNTFFSWLPWHHTLNGCCFAISLLTSPSLATSHCWAAPGPPTWAGSFLRPPSVSPHTSLFTLTSFNTNSIQISPKRVSPVLSLSLSSRLAFPMSPLRLQLDI